MRRSICVVMVVGLIIFLSAKGEGNQENKTLVKDRVRGGIAFPPAKRTWVRITGKATVLNASTMAYEDGTQVGIGDSPDLEQKGKIGDAFYPCGKEAAEFLKKLIGNQPVTCIVHPDHIEGKQIIKSFAFVGETSLNIEMLRNGWAISGHEANDPWEIFARENKRGLWHGSFIVPERWRKGDRLPGE